MLVSGIIHFAAAAVSGDIARKFGTNCNHHVFYHKLFMLRFLGTAGLPGC
jgi:hypothetical protein